MFLFVLNVSFVLEFETVSDIFFLNWNRAKASSLRVNLLGLLNFGSLRNKVFLRHVTIIEPVCEISVVRGSAEVYWRDRLLFMRRSYHIHRNVVVMVYYDSLGMLSQVFVCILFLERLLRGVFLHFDLFPYLLLFLFLFSSFFVFVKFRRKVLFL